MYALYFSFDGRGSSRCEIAETLHRIEVRYRRRIDQENGPIRQAISGQIALELLRERFSHIEQCVICLAAERNSGGRKVA